MKSLLLTREYPPEVYGGAGVHVEYLARELARVAEVTVHCWGAERPQAPEAPTVVAHRPWDALAGAESYAPALQALSIDLTMAAGAVAMSASTIVVAANAQLLRRVRLAHDSG